MDTTQTILYYVHDPMCSWCWGFRPTWQVIMERLDKDIHVQYLLGGLAPDTDDPMSQALQTTIHNTWKRIQQTIPGTEFNFDFWTVCQPRRSTYPSCRAVIATQQQAPAQEAAMLLAIQEAYYLQARNPSDDDVLIDLARGLDLDTGQFSRDLSSPETRQVLLSEIRLCRELGARSFPGLVLKHDDDIHMLRLDYNDQDVICRQIEIYLDTG